MVCGVMIIYDVMDDGKKKKNILLGYLLLPPFDPNAPSFRAHLLIGKINCMQRCQMEATGNPALGKSF